LVAQEDGERGATPLPALQRDPAAVGGGELPHQPQPEAQPAALRGRGVRVPLEDPLLIGRRDADAVIANRDRDAVAGRLDLDAHGTFLTELQGVREEISDDLFDLGPIPPPAQIAQRHDAHLTGSTERHHPFDGGPDRLANVDRARLERCVTDTFELGQRVDQRLEALHLRLRHP